MVEIPNRIGDLEFGYRRYAGTDVAASQRVVCCGDLVFSDYLAIYAHEELVGVHCGPQRDEFIDWALCSALWGLAIGLIAWVTFEQCFPRREPTDA